MGRNPVRGYYWFLVTVKKLSPKEARKRVEEKFFKKKPRKKRR